MRSATAIFLMLMVHACAERCFNHQGQSFVIGATECLDSRGYSESQWATCLTQSYVLRSGYMTIECLNSTVCWLPCQLEFHDLYEGSVYDNCRCSTDDPSPITMDEEEATTLSPECFSPGGINCNWYPECLEKRYSCEGTEDAYAISFAEKYCNLYSENIDLFTEPGQKWVNGVRHCLQLALVPAIRPWNSRTCKQLSREAFDSHPGCYLNPRSNTPSICDLPCVDAISSFFIVNVIGNAFQTAPVETGIQMLKVIQGCYFASTGCTGVGITTLVLTLRTGLGFFRAQAATKVGLFVATLLNLDDTGIGWFPYYTDNEQETERRRRNTVTDSSNTDNNSIFILLADLQYLGITPPGPTNTTRQTLNETVEAFADAAENGQLSNIPVTVNSTEVILSVSSVGQCEDTLCSNVNTTGMIVIATAPPPTVGNGAIATNAAITVYVIMMYIMLHCTLMHLE